MEIHDKHLEDLKEIRSIMERSSRFISLSGLSGIFAGIYALIGAGIAWKLIQTYDYSIESTMYSLYYGKGPFLAGKIRLVAFLLLDAFVVLTLALTTGIYLTTRQARKNGQSIWDKSSQRMIINLAIPLVTGGIFTLILLYYGYIILIGPSMLIFYGLALINGSKYTLTDIRYLGFCEIALGLVSMFYFGYGLVFWAVGFGVLHILYGSIMYFKYER